MRIGKIIMTKNGPNYMVTFILPPPPPWAYLYGHVYFTPPPTWAYLYGHVYFTPPPSHGPTYMVTCILPPLTWAYLYGHMYSILPLSPHMCLLIWSRVYCIFPPPSPHMWACLYGHVYTVQGEEGLLTRKFLIGFIT